MLQCLTTIVGITKSDCECILGGLSAQQIENLRISTSGLYMDDLPGGVHLKALKRVDSCRDMYDMAITARNNAIKTLEDDLIIAINTKYKKDKTNFTGQIGRMSFAQSLALSYTWQAIQVRPVDAGDTMITVKKIQVIINQSIPLVVKLFRVPIDTVSAEEIGSWPVNALANLYTNVDFGSALLQLPTHYNGVLVEYYFAYDLAGTTAAPKDTTVICLPCQGGVLGYDQYITVNGAEFSTPLNLGIKNRDSYSRGFILDVSIRCDSNKLFCDVYDKDDAIAVTFAWAVQNKAGELLIEYVNQSADVNRYTTMAKEYLWGKRNHFRAEYDYRMKYLEQIIDVSSSNCYVCRDTVNQPSLHTILI